MDRAYVGIDPSYSGLAISVLYAGAQGLTHVSYLEAFPKERYGDGVDRRLAIRGHVSGVLNEVAWKSTVAHVCLEGYAPGRINGRELAGELCGSIKEVVHNTLHEEVRYPTIVPPTSLKLFATGKGGAPKNVVLLKVFQRWGVEFADDNEADAYVLARMAMALDGAEPVKVEHERRALKALKVHTEAPVLTRR